MKKKHSAKTPGENRLYAIFNQKGRLLRKATMRADEIQKYLNEKGRQSKSYYAIELDGLGRKLTAAELRPLENKIKKEKSTLPAEDLADLKTLLKVLKTRPAREGMIKAFHFDTALRDEIPISIWKKMGGETF